MGSLCCTISSERSNVTVLQIKYTKADDISISPRYFVKENSNSFLSVYQIHAYPIGLGSVGEV